jgi:hypothetical protein
MQTAALDSSTINREFESVMNDPAFAFLGQPLSALRE